ncbi:MarR family transcriptional regulator [Streptomyces sp. P11-1]|uniref:MarR family transcriptional regulator n=1 Tax=Streptomyces sp. P11-1 TaxID=3423221 RepID=UPI003D2ED12F
MATQHISSALQPPALSDAYPMANPGYGKRSAPNQLPRSARDFSLLPTRERYVAGFVDHLPEGASMSVKQLAKQLPLYGQQAISTALTALSVAGHLRRVRCPVGAGEETRWVFRTSWSRTARDNEWWNTYLATETAKTQAATPDTALPPPSVPTEQPPVPAPVGVGGDQRAELSAVPQQRNPPHPTDTTPKPPSAFAREAATPPTPEGGLSPAYLALARLGREDHRLALSADDCVALEPQAAKWLARGVTVDYLTSALTAGLPAEINSPVGFLRRRLTTKLPPHLPTETTPPSTAASAARVLVECTECRTPGPPQALPDGLCRPCRETHNSGVVEAATAPSPTPDVKAHMANLRSLLKSV